MGQFGFRLSKGLFEGIQILDCPHQPRFQSELSHPVSDHVGLGNGCQAHTRSVRIKLVEHLLEFLGINGLRDAWIETKCEPPATPTVGGTERTIEIRPC